MNATSSIWTKEFRYRLILRKALLGLAAHPSLKDQEFQVTLVALLTVAKGHQILLTRTAILPHFLAQP